MTETARAIASWLRGGEPVGATDLVQVSNAHGTTPLLAQRLRRMKTHGLEPALAASLEAEARMHVAHEVVRQRQLRELLEELEARAIPILVIKGEALARTHYEEMWLRPRCDTDVLIERERFSDLTSVLKRGGYAEEPCSGGELISRQRMWVRVDPLGIRHCIDLHWALSNRPRYAHALSFVELWSRGVALQRGSVRMPSPGDALLVAALHLVGHHHHAPRLIWLYDIHLLHRSMSADELRTAAMLARERKIDMALDVAIALAVQAFGDGRPARSIAQSPMEGLLEDLRFMPGFLEKVRLMREHLFPPSRYLLQKYGVTSRAALPALYLRRIASASARFWRRPV